MGLLDFIYTGVIAHFLKKRLADRAIIPHTTITATHTTMRTSIMGIMRTTTMRTVGVRTKPWTTATTTSTMSSTTNTSTKTMTTTARTAITTTMTRTATESTTTTESTTWTAGMATNTKRRD